MEKLKPELKIKTGLNLNTTTKARTPDANMEAEIFRRSTSTPRSPPSKKIRTVAIEQDVSLNAVVNELSSSFVDETVMLGDIKNERMALEDFLFNENNKISKNAIKFILSKWSFLESKLYEDRLEKEKLKATYLGRISTKTYAGVVSGPMGPMGPVAPPLQPETEKNKIRKEHEVVIIKPVRDTDKRNNDQIKQDIIKELEGSRNKLKIQRIRQMRNKGMVIEVGDSKDVDLIKRTDWAKVGLKMDEPSKLNPSIIIYDVEVDYKEKDLKEDLIKKNLDFLDHKQQEKLESEIIFKNKIKADNRVHWIVQLPGPVFEQIINRSRIFLMWRTYKVREFLNIVRCFKCHGYGHILKNCSQEQLCEACGQKDHLKKDCPKRQTPSCVNCVRSRRKDSNHEVRSNDCPEYKKQIEIYRSKIKWL